MTEINIYKTHDLIKIIPKLIESIVSQKTRIYLLCNDSEQVKELDYLLWSYSQLSFIPHGIISDPYQDSQMILIGTNPDYETKATILICLLSPDKTTLVSLTKKYEKILLFNYQLTEKLDCSAINIIEQDTTGKWVKNTI